MSLLQYQLNKCGKTITLMSRSVGVAGVDLDESFTNEATVKALIKTVRGTSIFDGSNVERPVTHEIRIAYLADITAEVWIEYGGRNFDILDIINCAEENNILILRVNERGVNTLEVNDA